MNIADILRREAQRRSDALAILDLRSGGRLTYAVLDRESQRAAALLHARGLGAGDRVLVLLPMSADLYVALIASWRLGLAVVFADYELTPEQMAHFLRLLSPKAILAGSDARHLTTPLALTGLPIIDPKEFKEERANPGGREKESRAPELLVDCTPDMPALLTFTSGSTGMPKVAVRTHGFLQAQHDALTQALDLTADEVDVTVLPVFLLANLGCGATSVIPDIDWRHPESIAPSSVVEQIRSSGATRITASPALLEILADHCLSSGTPLPGLRRILVGGAPVFPSILERLHRALPHARLIAVYGSTEAEPIAHVTYDEIGEGDWQHMLGGGGLLAGVPEPSVTVRILRGPSEREIGSLTQSAFEAECLSAGGVGEIVVSGDHVLKGYLGGEGDRQTKITVGDTVWHRTGDAGSFDDRGRLWLLGRYEARITDRCGELYPLTVECAATAHPAVRRAAVIALHGKRVLAVESRSPAAVDSPSAALPLGVDADWVSELRSTLRWAHIEEIRIVPAIPVDRRHHAKVDYSALRQVLENGG